MPVAVRALVFLASGHSVPPFLDPAHHCAVEAGMMRGAPVVNELHSHWH
jgi:hypothetical protein